jgi:hypothetical protein
METKLKGLPSIELRMEGDYLVVTTGGSPSELSMMGQYIQRAFFMMWYVLLYHFQCEIVR